MHQYLTPGDPWKLTNQLSGFWQTDTVTAGMSVASDTEEKLKLHEASSYLGEGGPTPFNGT